MSQAPLDAEKGFLAWLGLRSYSMRFAVVLSVVFSLAVVVAGGVSYNALSDELRTRLFDDARLSATNLAELLQSEGAENLATHLRSRAIIDRDNATLYYFAAPNITPIGSMALPTPFIGTKQLVAGTDFTIIKHKGQNEGELYFAYGLATPEGVIVVARDSQWISDSQEVLVQSVGWGLGFALLVSLGIAIILARRNAVRIARLNAVLSTAATGNLAARFNDFGVLQDDITQVAIGVNKTLEHLESNVERLQQVSADIAHDLRAPLTRLRMKLEPQAGRSDLPKDTEAAISQSLESISGIAATFDSILKLAQLESGNVRLEQAPVDLAQLLGAVHEMMSPVAEDMGHDLRVRAASGPVWIAGDNNLLTQAIINLVDNALLHSPSSTRVEITLQKERNKAHIVISDSGPGIPASERAKVTRRFYRLDASRNRPGAGLGLSLVAAITKQHGGEMRLEDNKPGLRVDLVFPLKGPAKT